MTNYPYQIGDQKSLSKTFTQKDFNRFAVLSGDDNPIHVDPIFSARTTFGKTVAHGMLLYGNIIQTLGSLFSSNPFVQIYQEMMFPCPTFVEEQVHIEIKITKINFKKRLIELQTNIRKVSGEMGLQGKTLVLVPLINEQIQWITPKFNIDSYERQPNLIFKNLNLGMTDVFDKIILVDDLIEYLDLLKDFNPLFNDAPFARSIGFESTIIPGSLIAGLISYQLGTRLPGPGTNWLKQKLAFFHPIYPNQKIFSTVEIIRIRSIKNLVNLRTRCYNKKKEVIMDGEALVHVQDTKI